MLELAALSAVPGSSSSAPSAVLICVEFELACAGRRAPLKLAALAPVLSGEKLNLSRAGPAWLAGATFTRT